MSDELDYMLPPERRMVEHLRALRAAGWSWAKQNAAYAKARHIDRWGYHRGGRDVPATQVELARRTYTFGRRSECDDCFSI